MSIKEKLYFKAHSFVAEHKRKSIAKQFNLSDSSNIPIEYLQIFKTISVTILDALVSKHDISGENILLKLDTQGNELDTLKKREKNLEQSVICVVEHMFVYTYKIGYKFKYLMDYIGFTCKGPLTISYRPSGEISSVDFLFIQE